MATNMMDEDIDVDELIDQVRLKPCIWDKSLPEHNTRATIIDAWRSVGAEMNPQFNELSVNKREIYCKMLQKKWRNIRDQWAKTCKKIADQKKSGTRAHRIKYYVHHKQLRFLKKNKESDMIPDSQNSNSQNSDTLDSKEDLDNENACAKIKAPWRSQPSKRTNEVPKEQHPWKKQKVDSNSSGSCKSPHSDTNSKLYFFRSVLPSIEDFSVDEMLELQSGVLNLIKGIKMNRYYHQPRSQQNDSFNANVSSPQYSPMNRSGWFSPYDQKPSSMICNSPSQSDLSVQSPSGSENSSS